MLKVHKVFEPFFSVIICTYNREALLPRAIDSLLVQTDNNWEAIIVDDGSSDSTYSLVNKYIQDHINIRYMYHKNMGLALSRNTGILASAGKYITFLDSDDEYLPEHLSIRKKIFEANPDIDLLHGGVEIIGNPYVPDAENPGEFVHLDKCVVGGTFFIKKEKALEIGGFPLYDFGDDYEFFKKAKKAGWKIVETNKKTYRYYRDTADAKCNTILKIKN